MELINPIYLNANHIASNLAMHVPFRGLDKNILHSIAGLGEILKVPAHTNVIVEGENSAGMYVLFEGLAGVYKSESSSRKGNLIKTLTQGEAFGEMSLIDRGVRSATVCAEVDLVLFYLSAEVWDQIIVHDAQTGLKLYQGFATDMSRRLRSMNDDLIVSQRQLWRVAFSRSLPGEAKGEPAEGSETGNTAA